MDNAMVLVIGTEKNGDLYIETVSDFDEATLVQIANTLFILNNGGLAEEIKKHLKRLGQSVSEEKRDRIEKLIRMWSKLERSYEDRPLVDSLQP